MRLFERIFNAIRALVIRRRLIYRIVLVIIISLMVFDICGPARTLPLYLRAAMYICAVIAVICSALNSVEGVVGTISVMCLTYYAYYGYLVDPCVTTIAYIVAIPHIDILLRNIILGIGLRRTRVGLLGMFLTIMVPTVIAGACIYIAYVISRLMDLMKDVVMGVNVVSKIVFGTLIESRVGVIIYVTLLLAITYYILTNYIAYPIIDAIMLPKNYIRVRLDAEIRITLRDLQKGKTWHQRIYKSIIYIFILSLAWAAVSPVINSILSIIHYELAPYIPVALRLAISFMISIVIYIMFRSLIKFFERLLTAPLKLPKPSKIRIKAGALRLWFYLALFITVMYIGYLFGSGLLEHALLAAIGFEAPRNTATGLHGVVYRFIEHDLGKILLDGTRIVRGWVESYIMLIVEEYKWAIKTIKLIIRLLWG